MKKADFIKKIEELDKMLVEELEAEGVSDSTRFHIHIGFEDMIDRLKEDDGSGGWDD